MKYHQLFKNLIFNFEQLSFHHQNEHILISNSEAKYFQNDSGNDEEEEDDEEKKIV